jgi:hypothetical protein
MISLTNAWHPSDGLQRLWNQIKNAANYAVFADSAIPESILVDSALICICKNASIQASVLGFQAQDESNAGAPQTIL